MNEITVRPADSGTWGDVETLLGQRGSVKGCWCMFFRPTPQQRRTDWGEGNRKALTRLVDAGARRIGFSSSTPSRAGGDARQPRRGPHV